MTRLGLKLTCMEALETSINYWEDALAAFSLGARGGVSGTLALTSPEEAEFCREIQDLLQDAYLLQERCELLFLDQRSVLFRSESGGGAGAAEEVTPARRSRLLSTHTASSHTRREHHSSAESFASAEDQVADLREFDDLTEALPELENLELYQAAVKQLEVGIPYRTLRTEVVQCSTDSEFLCKLHCLRQAFTQVFKDAAIWAWFVDAGRQVLTDLLLFADKEPKEFLVAYEEMVSWATDAANWTTIETELTTKGVKALTFYDVVLDYILLDAFEDLASPPSSVLAVVRNRWLSDGFKESALTTAVWSVIKAKRRYLQFPDGFMAHFYSISEHLLPVLVWGFLGPNERLRDVCESFQSEICEVRASEPARGLLGLRRVGRVYRRHRRAARRANLLQVAGAVEVQATLSDTSDLYIYAPLAWGSFSSPTVLVDMVRVCVSHCGRPTRLCELFTKNPHHRRKIQLD
ncbi:unnamed protein product [Spodoptera exigua]|nr:unnamed protein product [Spodoptera exigua]